MSVVVHCPWPNAERWGETLAAAFAARLPGERVTILPKAGGTAPDDADVVVLGGRPPDGLEAAFARARFLQAMGAGVDHLVPLVAGRPDLVVARTLDPGMPGRMADYVLAVVARVFRRLDVYERQQADAVWRHAAQPDAAADVDVDRIGRFLADHVDPGLYDCTLFAFTQRAEQVLRSRHREKPS